MLTIASSDSAFHLQALSQAKVTDPSKCFFVDDSRSNVIAAQTLGWGRCVHFSEQGMEVVEGGKKKIIEQDGENGSDNSVVVIGDLEELRAVWHDIFMDK